jgi:hypothetical protein
MEFGDEKNSVGAVLSLGARLETVAEDRRFSSNKDAGCRLAGDWSASVFVQESGSPPAAVHDRRGSSARFLSSATVIDRRYRLNIAGDGEFA